MWLPVAHRELIVASRHAKGFWLRLVPPTLGLLFLFLAGPSFASAPPAGQGRTIFTFVSLALFLYCAFAGLFFTAEAITSERREGTLPLLQITGMRELDLVLGKLLGNSLSGIYGFLAATPLLTLPLLLGGITGFEIFRVTVCLLGALLLSLSISIHVSSSAASGAEALRRSFLIIAVFLGVGVFAFIHYGLRRKVLNREKWTENLDQTGERAVLAFIFFVVWGLGLPSGSPMVMLFESLTPWRRILGEYGFWVESVLLIGMGVYFLLTARPFSLGAVDKAPAILESPVAPPKRLPSRLRPDPIAARFSHSPTDRMLVLGLGIIGGFFQFVGNLPLYAGVDNGTFIFSWLSFGAAVVLYFVIARRAADFLVQSRRSGMLEVLLVAPLPWKEILIRHRSAFFQLAWRAVAIFMVAEIISHLVALKFAQVSNLPRLSLFYVVAAVLTYVCSIYATLWCAIRFALRSRSATHAAVWTVLLVLVIPAALGFLLPFKLANPVAEIFYGTMISSGIFIVANTIVWIICHAQLKRMGGRSPAEIFSGE